MTLGGALQVPLSPDELGTVIDTLMENVFAHTDSGSGYRIGARPGSGQTVSTSYAGLPKRPEAPSTSRMPSTAAAASKSSSEPQRGEDFALSRLRASCSTTPAASPRSCVASRPPSSPKCTAHVAAFRVEEETPPDGGGGALGGSLRGLLVGIRVKHPAIGKGPYFRRGPTRQMEQADEGASTLRDFVVFPFGLLLRGAGTTNIAYCGL